VDFSHLIETIADIHTQSVAQASRSVNHALVIRNWLIGCNIVEYEQKGEDRAAYGEQLLDKIGKALKKRGMNACSRFELGRSRQFYRCFPQLHSVISTISIRATSSLESAGQTISRKRATPSLKSRNQITLSPDLLLRLSWSQIIELLKLDTESQRVFYALQCLNGNWSVRELQRQIGSLLYDRVGLSSDKKGLLQEIQKKADPKDLADLIRDPYVLEFTGLAEKPRWRESDLEQALLDHLQNFLLELGSGFCLEARQKRITVSNDHDYIDLVFYHRILRCHLLIDLKVRPFEHGDVGQMNFYLNWWKDNAMGQGDQLPVGLILCTAKDAVKVSYATAGLDQKLFVSRYRLLLPKPEELQKLLEADQARMMQEQAGRKRK
jgi:predicted nuclease of restriction endonuclease-like (RecB) superfamily